MSDTDLTQYNGIPNFPATADAGTSADAYLVPTDGKYVTAESNLTDEAPVNRALKVARDQILGLRSAVVGDFDAGAGLRSLRSLFVDGAGGASHATPPGNIEATGFVQGFVGLLSNQVIYALAPTSVVRVGVGECSELRVPKLDFVGTTTGAGGANPPQGTAIPNELRAINIPKVAAYVKMTSPGAIASFQGHGVSSAAIDPGNLSITLTFAVAFDDANFTVKFGAVRAISTYIPVEVSRTASTVQVGLVNLNASLTSGTVTYHDFSTAAVSFSVSADGKQTT